MKGIQFSITTALKFDQSHTVPIRAHSKHTIMCEDNKQYREEREQKGSFISTPQSSCFANAKNGSKC